MSTPPLLEAFDVSKQFGALKAVDGVSLSLPPGSFHPLLGETAQARAPSSNA